VKCPGYYKRPSPNVSDLVKQACTFGMHEAVTQRVLHVSLRLIYELVYSYTQQTFHIGPISDRDRHLYRSDNGN